MFLKKSVDSTNSCCQNASSEKLFQNTGMSFKTHFTLHIYIYGGDHSRGTIPYIYLVESDFINII